LGGRGGRKGGGKGGREKGEERRGFISWESLVVISSEGGATCSKLKYEGEMPIITTTTTLLLLTLSVPSALNPTNKI